MDTTLAVLLGLSGATTLLSSAVSPPATAPAPSKAPLTTGDVVAPPPFYGIRAREYRLLTTLGLLLTVARFAEGQASWPVECAGPLKPPGAPVTFGL